MPFHDLIPETIIVRQFAIPIQPSRLSFFVNTLSREENERAKSFIREQDQWRYIFCRGILRILLGKHSQIASKEVVFSYSVLGKPSLIENKKCSFLKFNLSHTDDCLLVACALRAEVGIDVERIRPISNFIQIMEQYYSCEENQCILSLPKEEQLAAFFHCWTRKEALLKGLGIGIGNGLEMIKQMSCLNNYFKMKNRNVSEEWSIETLASPASYKVGLAYQGTDLSIENRMERWEDYL